MADQLDDKAIAPDASLAANGGHACADHGPMAIVMDNPLPALVADGRAMRPEHKMPSVIGVDP